MYTLVKEISETNTKLIELGIIAKRNAEVEGGEVNKEIQYHIMKATNHITKALSKAIDPNKATGEEESARGKGKKEEQQKLKECPKCNTVKPKTEFYRNKTRNDGLSYWCKECNEEYPKKYKQKGPKNKRGKQGEEWTKEEEIYLWENKDKNIERLSEALGRSPIAIQTRLRILKRVAETKANITQ